MCRLITGRATVVAVMLVVLTVVASGWSVEPSADSPVAACCAANADAPSIRVTQAPSAAADRIRAVLEAATVMDFVETPLQDCIDYLKDYHKIEIKIDKKALDAEGIGTDTPVTRSLRGISLKSALRLLLKDLGMTYIVYNEVLLITTKTEHDTILTTQVYDVRDLLEADRQDRISRGDAGIEFDYDSLVDSITATIGPTTWDAVGGPGSIEAIYGTLTISQTELVHEQVAALLAAFRKVLNSRAKATGNQNVQVKPADPAEIVLRVYKIASQGKLSPDAVRAVGGGGGGFFAVADPVALAQASAAPDKDKKPPQTPAPVAQKGPAPVVDPFRFVQELASAIPQLVEPATWSQAGGTGAIHAIPPSANSRLAGALVVRQTRAVHVQIAQLLSELKGKGLGGI